VEANLRFLVVLTLLSFTLGAEPVPVQQAQGAAQGFLVVRDANGQQIGTGNLQQAVHGGRITSRILYRLNDGSVDDETTIFTQARVFHVVSDHHVQHGPLFDKALDVAFDTASGTVVTRNPNSTETREHEKNIPADVVNGIAGTILLNVKPTMAPLTLSAIAPISTGRVITITITPEGEGDFTISGIPHKAAIYRIHPKLGGVAGAIAPVIGKEPKDVLVWVIQGSAPALVREICQFSVGGPVLSIELAGTRFRPLSSSKP
jgi:hypothetical protein